MPSEKNIEKVKELSSSFEKAKAIYFTEYHGLNVEQITNRGMHTKSLSSLMSNSNDIHNKR